MDGFPTLSQIPTVPLNVQELQERIVHIPHKNMEALLKKDGLFARLEEAHGFCG